MDRWLSNPTTSALRTILILWCRREYVLRGYIAQIEAFRRLGSPTSVRYFPYEAVRVLESLNLSPPADSAAQVTSNGGIRLCSRRRAAKP